MGSAEAYLLKAGLRERLIDTDPHPDLKIIVTLPVHNESGLERCLDSLFSVLPVARENTTGTAAPLHTEVLILVNASFDAAEAVLDRNLKTLEATRNWIEEHPHPSLDFHVWLDHSFMKKEAGVGLARKILMDEAVRRLGMVDNPRGIIASLDADVVVDPNYLEALAMHFGDNDREGCSIYFEHPLGPDSPEDPGPPFGTFSPGVYDAITQYELHLRYYLNAVRSTGFPHAFHTVGSSFAVRADVYCKEGGMNRRKGGEDFYFIQKVAQRGYWNECNTTRVIASPRPSGRVPFGTGPVVERLLKEMAQQTEDRTRLTTYHPEPFGMLKKLFSAIDSMYSGTGPESYLQALPAVLPDFLETQDFEEALAEIRRNSASPEAFQKRFWRWFNMFRIMKFLHYAREKGYPDMDVCEAAQRLITGTKSKTAMDLLIAYREKDRHHT